MKGSTEFSRRGRLVSAIALAAAAGCVPGSAAGAGAGSIDRSFGERGFAVAGEPIQGDSVRTATLDERERIITVGSSRGSLQLTRLTPDGRPDPSFGEGGRVEVAFDGQHVRADDAITDGSAILTAGFSGFDGGDQASPYDFQVTRFTSEGALDPEFGENGVAVAPGLSHGAAHSIAQDSRGRIWAAGRTSHTSGGPSDLAVARFKPDGRLDRGFADGGIWRHDLEPGPGRTDEWIDDIAVDDRGRLLFAGTQGPSKSSGNMLAGRLLPNGKLDRAYGDGGVRRVFVLGDRYSYASAIAVDHDGRAVIAGSAQNKARQNEFAVARLRPDGRLDDSFSDDGLRQLDIWKSDATDVDVLGGDRVMVSGRADGVTNTPQAAAVVLTRNGGLDRKFGSTGRFTARFGFASRSEDALVGQPGRVLLAGGTEQRTPDGQSSQTDIGVVGLKKP